MRPVCTGTEAKLRGGRFRIGADFYRRFERELVADRQKQPSEIPLGAALRDDLEVVERLIDRRIVERRQRHVRLGIHLGEQPLLQLPIDPLRLGQIDGIVAHQGGKGVVLREVGDEGDVAGIAAPLDLPPRRSIRSVTRSAEHHLEIAGRCEEHLAVPVIGEHPPIAFARGDKRPECMPWISSLAGIELLDGSVEACSRPEEPCTTADLVVERQ